MKIMKIGRLVLNVVFEKNAFKVSTVKLALENQTFRSSKRLQNPQLF